MSFLKNNILSVVLLLLSGFIFIYSLYINFHKDTTIKLKDTSVVDNAIKIDSIKLVIESNYRVKTDSIILVHNKKISYVEYKNKNLEQRLKDLNIKELPISIDSTIREAYYIKDTIIDNQKFIIAQKDTIIKLDSLKIESYKRDSISSNTTIDAVSKEYRQLNREYNTLAKKSSKQVKLFKNIAKIGVVTTIIEAIILIAK